MEEKIKCPHCGNEIEIDVKEEYYPMRYYKNVLTIKVKGGDRHG